MLLNNGIILEHIGYCGTAGFLKHNKGKLHQIQYLGVCAAELNCFVFVLNSIFFPPQSRNFVKTLYFKIPKLFLKFKTLI